MFFNVCMLCYVIEFIMQQDHNASNVMSLNSLELTEQDTPSIKKNVLTLVRILSKNFERRQKSIDLLKYSCLTNFKDIMG